MTRQLEDGAARRWLGIAATVVIVLLSWVVLDVVRDPNMDDGALWAARAAVGSLVVLLATLVVVWRYTDVTAAILRATQDQSQANRDMLDAARGQSEQTTEMARATLALAEQAARQADAATRSLELLEAAQLPCIVIEWKHLPSPPGHPPSWTYVARNIGPGRANNAAYVEDIDSASWSVVHLGAFGPGDERELPPKLVQAIYDDNFRTNRYYVVAQPAVGTEWIVSGNARESNHRMSHVYRKLRPTDAQVVDVSQSTVGEYVRAHWPQLQAELSAMAKELDERPAGRADGEGTQ
jgi:hypothetical protein